MDQIKPQERKVDNRVIFSNILKNIKTVLPKSCTFLSPFKTASGEYQARAIINGTTYHFTVPANLSFTKADIKELSSQLLEICKEG